MERRPRRFRPGQDALEPRALLSGITPQAAEMSTMGTPTPGSRPRAATPGGTAAAQSQAPVGIPATLEQKLQRVDRLPAYLDTIAPDRVLPVPIITQLQADLRTIIGQLRRPPRGVVEGFNIQLRSALPYQNLRPEDARALNNAFGNVLKAAGATDAATERLKASMNALAHADANSPQAVRLATNDYALVLQTALGIGQPIQGVPATPVPRNVRRR